MTDRELMQQALDALDLHAKQYPHMVKGYTADAAEALRARLAQPEQEPVADKYLMEVECTKCGAKQDGILTVTAPPQREWVGLTDEEMFSLWVKCPAETEDRFAFARAIEAKLKEKNHG
jgi:hypothetical protein